MQLSNDRRVRSPRPPRAPHLAVLLLTLVLGGLVCAPQAGAQKLYKWKDESGNVVYSQTPPPQRDKADEVKLIGVGGKPPADTPKEEKDKLVDGADAAAKDREFKGQVEADEAKRQELFKKNCEIARNNLRILSAGSRVKTLDKDGKEIFVDDKERASRTKIAQQQIKDYCS